MLWHTYRPDINKLTWGHKHFHGEKVHNLYSSVHVITVIKKAACVWNIKRVQIAGWKTCYLFLTGLFFFFSSLYAELPSLTCFQIPVLLTSSEILIDVRGIFIMLPLARGICRFPAGSISALPSYKIKVIHCFIQNTGVTTTSTSSMVTAKYV
jgi:hypothetical protein